MKTVAQALQNSQLREDSTKTLSHICSNDHRGSDPVALCETCGTPTQKDVNIPGFGGERRVPIVCVCRAKANEDMAKADEEAAKRRRIERFKSYTFADSNFDDATFANWVRYKGDEQLFTLATGYCKHWDEMSANNHGIIFHGNAGSGKTFIAHAIANGLTSRGTSAMSISISQLMNAIRDSYDGSGGIGEQHLLSAIREVSLLILDDVGVEQKTSWSYDKLYTIIDTRYRAGKPLIITTNLNMLDLRSRLRIVDQRRGIVDASDRIWSRICSLCAPYEVKGTNWRSEKSKSKKDSIDAIVNRVEFCPSPLPA